MGIAVGRDLTGGVCDYLTRAKRAVARTTFTPREQGTTQHAAHPPDTRVCAKSDTAPRSRVSRVCALPVPCRLVSGPYKLVWRPPDLHSMTVTHRHTEPKCTPPFLGMAPRALGADDGGWRCENHEEPNCSMSATKRPDRRRVKRQGPPLTSTTTRPTVSPFRMRGA